MGMPRRYHYRNISFICLIISQTKTLPSTRAFRPFSSIIKAPISPSLRSTLLFASSSSSSSTQSPPPTTSTTSTSSDKKKTAIIVGGGPIGLATALTLSNPPHSYSHVTLLEQTTPSSYDPTKAYLYLVNRRGQTWMEQCNFPSVMEKLKERGSLGRMENFVLVSGDPQEEIPEKKITAWSATIPTKGQMKDPMEEKKKKKEEESGGGGYWVQRHVMVEILQETIEMQEEERRKRQSSSDGDADDVGEVTILSGRKCVGIDTLSNGQIQVTVEEEKKDEGVTKTFLQGDLLVGADGIRSAVRTHLYSGEQKNTEGGWLSKVLTPRVRDRFGIRSWRSPASGLRMKILQFPSNFTIPNKNIVNDTADTTFYETECESIFAIRSFTAGPNDRMALGFLPVKNPNAPRTGNVIARPHHHVWKKATAVGGQACKLWFKKAFPRMINFDQLIDDEEWERFAQSEGTIFPNCQRCDKVQVSDWNVDGNGHAGGDHGIVLVGDALHAFPPDIGQGINAGLCDVVALDRALRKCHDDTSISLGEALASYEHDRIPETRALIRLARFGSPYQYNQSSYPDRVGKLLWTANLVMRMILNKVTNGMMPKPAMIMAQDRNMTYREVMRKADGATWVLRGVGLGIGLGIWFGRKLLRL